MAKTERREFSLNGFLFVALALLLMCARSSIAETKTTCQRVPAPNGGHWTVKTTVTFKAPRKLLKRTCPSVVDSATTVSPQTTTEARTESKKYTPYKIVKEAFDNDQTTTEARITNESYSPYNIFVYNEDYDQATKEEISVSPQTTMGTRIESNEYTPYEMVEETFEYNQSTTEAGITTEDYNRYNIVVDSEEHRQEPMEITVPREEFYRYNIAVDNEVEGQTALESETEGSPSPPSSSPPTVRSDYTYYDGVGYYKLHQTLKTWLEAKLTCEEEGGHLAIINSKEEENAIVGLMSPSVMMFDNVFIGLHDRNNEGQFLTVLDDPLESVGYINWAMGQPSDSMGDQNCGTVIGSGGINDYFCDERLYFLCELPLL